MVYEHGENLVCPVCNSRNIIFDPMRGEYVCGHCGTVVSDKIVDVGREWRIFQFSDVNSKSRTGRSLTNAIHDKGLTTTFSVGGKGVSKTMRKKLREMKRIQTKMRISKKEKHIVTGLKYLNEFVTKLELPNYVREHAAMILQKALEEINAKEKTIKAMAAAAILLASKAHGLPKTLRLIAKELGMTEKEIWHAEKRIISAVKRINVKMPDPKGFIPYLVSTLKLSAKVQYLAAYLTYLAKKKELASGRGPIGLAAASVYVASILLDEKRTQQEVASACNITDVTIRNRYSDIIENFDIEVRL
ncbi:transcription initiation factor IIB family protein [Desulfurococcaceae archaeon MEX13E-LK6-19]|nr:transcription initiation factor IIB family protein [Desulfurococcaceae archaeon MEX13E-LK6-19]